MTITLRGKPRFDSRGLPEGYDPGQLFQYRYDTVVKDAKGFESFLYKLMPASLVKSISFAIDPTYRFKVSPATITPVNRTRYRQTASVLQTRRRTKSGYHESWSQLSNFKGVAFCSSPYLVNLRNDFANQTAVLPSQPALYDISKDTTARTRLPGSKQGEFEKFKSTLFCSGRAVEWPVSYRQYTDGVPFDESCSLAGGTPDYEVGSIDVPRYTWEGPSAILSLNTYDALIASEKAFCQALAQKYAISMLKGISPFSRDYSLLRNAIELRDIPRSILQLQKTMENLRKVFDSFASGKKNRDLIFDLKASARDVPNEWLSFHFGWKQTYKDLVDLLDLPEKMSKKIDFLIRRSNKLTTFRSQRVHLSAETGISGFEYDTVSNFEFLQTTQSRIVRESEVRLVVSAMFDFPPINVPSLRREFFFLSKAGVTPRFIDIYNLIPYSWLFDWFTGLGNYLELIEEINHDPSLIHWGMITTVTRGSLISDYSSVVPRTTQIIKNNIQTEYTVKNIPHKHQSILEYECQIRKDVASILDVKQTSVPSSLTEYQYSILGAILAQRTGNSGKGTFRPSS